MKKTNFGYIYHCKNWRVKRNKKIAKDIAIMGVLYFVIMSGMNLALTYRDLLKDSGQMTYSVNVARAQEVILTPKEQVMKILKQKGASEEFKTKLLCLIEHESNWNTEKRGVNIHKDGTISLDEGIYQINSRLAPFKISRECTYNIACSTTTVVDYLLKTGNFSKWFGFKYNCQ